MTIDPGDVALIGSLRRTIESVIVGKTNLIKLAVTSLLSRGHILIEDIPGVGKTALSRALARSITCSFKRIQFTPDLLPGDVTGITVFDQARHEFSFKPGPVFANIILADEINRASPRTQSALLEAMNEAQVSIDGVTHKLPSPFMVIATQNPFEYTGTYPLPESQLDRFLMVLKIGYPSPEEEKQILLSRRGNDPIDSMSPAMSSDQLQRLTDKVRDIRMDDAITSYVVELASRTRVEKGLLAGVSPRGAIHLARAAQAHAMVDGRGFVLPDDVKAVALAVLSHRVIEKKVRASAEGRNTVQEILARILKETPVPQ